MIKFLVKRLSGAIFVLVSISFLVYLLIYLMPGDPAYVLIARRQMGMTPSDAEVEELRKEYGLDKPIIVQYLSWLGDSVKGDFGYSIRTNTPIIREIKTRVGPTLLLAIVTTMVSVVIAIPTGFLAAWRENSFWDHASRWLGLLGVSIPNYWLGFLLILIFSIYLHWLPTHGIGSIKNLILPVVCMGLARTSALSRVTRSYFIGIRKEEYLLAARAKGLDNRTALFKHGLPNIAGPIIALVAAQFSYMVAGSLIIETLFAWPGIGNYFITSVKYRDITAVQAIVVLFATVFILLNLISDLAHASIDRRIRVE